MSKVAIHNKNGTIFISNKLSYPEAVNERVSNAIAMGLYEGLIPVMVNQKRKETQIDCCIKGLIPLNQYFRGVVYKQMFLDMAYKITMLIKDCEKNMGSGNNLDLQKDRVFVNPTSRDIKCVYWPIVNNQRSNPPYNFLKQLPYGIKFSPNEDQSYLKEYTSFFDGFNPFSINNFERLLLKLQGKSVRDPSSILSETIADTPSGFLTDVKNTGKNFPNGMDYEFDPFSVVNVDEKEYATENPKTCFCATCGFENDINDNFCSKCGNRLKKPIEEENKEIYESVEQVVPSAPVEAPIETVLLGYETYNKSVKYPVLLRSKNGEQYTVDKPIYRIGKGRDSCELVISDNTYISRNHASIILKNNKYYIVDNGSTNKTFVDGREIPRDTEIELVNESKFKLANEEFVFYI